MPRIVESVTSESGPWVHRVIESEAGLIRAAISGADVLVIELDGSKMRSIDRLFAEYQQRFSFPDYFGWNWNAFDECLGDLRWLPARKYVTIISHADQVLSNERTRAWDVPAHYSQRREDMVHNCRARLRAGTC